MKPFFCFLVVLVSLPVVVGCGGTTEATVTAPDEAFFQDLQATEVGDDEAQRNTAAK